MRGWYDRRLDWWVSLSERPKHPVNFVLIPIGLAIALSLFFVAWLPFWFDWPDWVKAIWVWNILFE